MGPRRYHLRLHADLRSPRAVLLAASITAGCASAPAEGPPAAGARGETLSFTFENDIFGQSDNGYTDGLNVGWVSAEARELRPDSLAKKWLDFADVLPLVPLENPRKYATWSFGQEIYTPTVISTANPPASDQPYAGILFADFGIVARGDRHAQSWRVRLGVVGPESGADWVQESVHEALGITRPLGWSQQLPTEPVINIDYTFAPTWIGTDGEGVAWRAIPAVGAGAGTYFTGAGASLIGAVGVNLPETIGLSTLRRGVDPLAPISVNHDRASFAFFAGAGGFVVGHFLPLDGTVFRGSRSVESEPTVGYLTGGLRWSGSGFSLGLQYTAFSDTFEGQRSDPNYGAITLTWSR